MSLLNETNNRVIEEVTAQMQEEVTRVRDEMPKVIIFIFRFVLLEKR